MIKKIRSLLNKIYPSANSGSAKQSHEPRSVTGESDQANNINAPTGISRLSSPSEHNQRKKNAAAKATPIRSAPPEQPWDPASFNVSASPGKVRFHDLDLPEALMHAVADLGFQYCTPIQAEILPSTLAGKDAFGRAQTGTGKTAAFLITVITHMHHHPQPQKAQKGTPRILVLAPTRELVLQIAEEARSLCKYTGIQVTTIFGGMDYEKQRRQLDRTRNDIIVATPGRLLDFKRQGQLRLDNVEIMIIDEADRMLDMGFIPDVRKIIYATPHKSKRQTLLFSATLTPEVRRLAQQWTKDPVTVEIEPSQVAVDTVEQIVYLVTKKEKNTLLYNIITGKQLDRVIVFCNRKDETRRLSDLLQRYNMNCAVLSGDVRQQTRVRTLDNFKAGKIKVLVATDVAGRGIHIEGMDHVINYTLPRDPEDYVHRIGRTGRAGSAGTSISFADEEDSFYIPAIEKLIGQELPCIYPEEEWLAALPVPSKRKSPSRPSAVRRPAMGARSRSLRRRPSSHRSPMKKTGRQHPK